jgi:hypothetical protein
MVAVEDTFACTIEKSKEECDGQESQQEIRKEAGQEDAQDGD